MMRNTFPYIISLCFFLTGCIDEYDPEGIDQTGGFLIVDGMITDGESVFRLSRSVGINASLDSAEIITNASLYVETDQGERIEGRHNERFVTGQDRRSNNPLATAQQLVDQGVYTVPTGKLDLGRQYRLHISVDGEEYESAFLKPLDTPEIDSLSATKKDRGEPVVISVTTHGTPEQSSYYRWSFYETWEVKAENALWGYFPSGIIDPEGIGLVWFSSLSEKQPDNFYYCWGRDTSKVILVATTEQLTENRIYQYPLLEIPCEDERLSILYHIEVQQTALRKEAYDYFNNLRMNVEQTGSIFSPVPGEMKGNISCTTRPDRPVIGYIEVSPTTRKDLYTSEKGSYYEPPSSSYYMVGCSWYILYPPVLPFPDTFRETGKPCYDCRHKTRASKDRPPAWPTEDY
jgi:hypothetical protein